MTNTTQLYGATYSTDIETFGEVISTFPVDADWDGYRYHGYRWATKKEVGEYLAEQSAYDVWQAAQRFKAAPMHVQPAPMAA